MANLSRMQIYWVCIAQSLVLLPILWVLPKLFAVYWVAVALWRIQLDRNSYSMPGKIIKTTAAGLGIAALFFSFTNFLSVETFVAFFVISFSLKLLEIENRDGASLLLSLCFVALGAIFLFHQSIWVFVYALFCLVAIFRSMVLLYRTQQRSNFAELKFGAYTLALVLPVAVFLFLVLPRAGQLWHMPSQSKVGNTGFSKTMSPGTFSELIKSDKVAFRVSFESGGVPLPEQRYWRGMALDFFDGREWSQRGFVRNLTGRGKSSIATPTEWDMEFPANTAAIRYTVLLEPHLQNILFTLMGPITASSNSLKMAFASDTTLRTRTPVASRTRYNMTSSLDYRYQKDGLERYQRSPNLSVPQRGNQRSARWGAELRAKFGEGAGADKQIISEVLKFYNKSFVYTLKPPLNTNNIVDEFLFETQRGFCEHFAGSFVYVMRAAGIPARVIVGYLGGEYNDSQDYMVIRQRDAHAWAEVWLEGDGWVRVDPTAAVSPERIEGGLREAINDEEVSLIGGLPSTVRWISWMQLQLEVLDYRWQRAVLSYDENTQSRFFKRFLGGEEVWRIALFFVAAVACIIVVYFAIALLPSRARYNNPEAAIYALHLKRMARFGYVKLPSETPSGFANRVAKLRPEWAQQIVEIAERYNRIAYDAKSSDYDALRKLVRGL